MSDDLRLNFPESSNVLDLDAEQQVDAIASRFDEQWRSEQRPEIEAYLSDHREPIRSALLGALLRVELEYRRARQENPTEAEYCQRFPEHTELIHRLFQLLPAELAQTGRFPPRSDTVADAEALPGRIGRYRVVERLDKRRPGGQGEVYRAVHPSLGRDVVIKHAREGLSEQACQKVLDEGRILMHLDDPGLVRVLDADIWEGRPFVVFEHVRGRLLADVIHQEQLPPRRAAGLVAELAGTLAHIHGKDVLHGDLKPANVLIDEAGTPRLLDFGMSSLRQLYYAVAPLEGISGTLAYMAPEQARGQSDALGPLTDVFGLGALLYHLLTFRPPYQGTTQSAILEQARECLVVPPRQINPRVPRALERICQKAMAPDPKMRYTSAAAMRRALRAYPRRRRLVGLGLAVLLVTAVAGLVWLLLPDRAPSPAPGLEGELDLRIWSPHKPGLQLDQAGALPIHNGEQVQIEARLNQPGYIYLLWVGNSGKPAPLYPWNEGLKLIQKDAGAAPPIREAKEVHCPPDKGMGWKVTGKSGLVTVMMVARRMPLPAEVSLGELIGNLPAPRRQNEPEWVRLRHQDDGGAGRVLKRAFRRDLEEEAGAIENPVVRVMGRLRQHFEVIRAFRFTHQE